MWRAFWANLIPYDKCSFDIWSPFSIKEVYVMSIKVNRQMTLLGKRPSWAIIPLTKHPQRRGTLINYFVGMEKGLLSELTDKRPSLVLKTLPFPIIPLTKHPQRRGTLINYFVGTEKGFLSELTDKRPSLVLKTLPFPISKPMAISIAYRAFCPSRHKKSLFRKFIAYV